MKAFEPRVGDHHYTEGATPTIRMTHVKLISNTSPVRTGIRNVSSSAFCHLRFQSAALSKMGSVFF